jgi:hypothetical protein
MMTLYPALNDLVGPKELGAAIRVLDARGDCKCVNAVRCFGLNDFSEALVETPTGKERGQDLAALYARNSPRPPAGRRHGFARFSDESQG